MESIQDAARLWLYFTAHAAPPLIVAVRTLLSQRSSWSRAFLSAASFGIVSVLAMFLGSGLLYALHSNIPVVLIAIAINAFAFVYPVAASSKHVGDATP